MSSKLNLIFVNKPQLPFLSCAFIFDRVNNPGSKNGVRKNLNFLFRVGVTKHLKYWSINSGECAVMLFIRGSKCKQFVSTVVRWGHIDLRTFAFC